MNWLGKLYRTLVDHLGKLLSGAGAVLLSLDVAGYGDQIKQYALDYLGPNGAKKVGAALFILLFLRTAYTGWKSKQPPDILPPPVVQPPK